MISIEYICESKNIKNKENRLWEERRAIRGDVEALQEKKKK